MKKNYLSIVTLLFCIPFISCKSDKKDEPAPAPAAAYACATCNSNPEAMASNDSKGEGVYKGVLTGSTGSFKLILQGGVRKVIVRFDGVIDTLVTSGTITAGQPIDMLFTGTKVPATGFSLRFQVQADGTYPMVTTTVPGHTVTSSVGKETSTAVLKCYEGTYAPAKPGAGALNIWVKGNEGRAIASGPGAPVVLGISGATVTNVGGDIEIKGTISADETSGTFKNTKNNDMGTWSGKRIF